MRTIKNKYIVIMLCILPALLMTACGGNGNDKKQAEKYVARELELPEHSSVNAEYTYDNILYLAVADFDDDSQLKDSGIYAWDLSGEDNVPERIPVDLQEGEYIQNLAVDEEGIYVFLYNILQETEHKPLLKKWDKSGKLIREYEVAEYFAEKDAYVSAFEIDSEGKVIFCNQDNEIYVLDNQDTMNFHINAGGYVIQLCRGKSGRIYAAYYGNSGLELNEVDMVQKGLGKKFKLPQDGSYIKLACGVNEELLVGSESAMYGYQTESSDYDQILKWTDCDVVSSLTGSMLSLADARILLLNKDYTESNMNAHLYEIRQAGQDELTQAERTILTYGGISMFIDETTRKAITDFNRSNTEYRIEIKEYGTEDIAEGITQMNADIISGKAPDIFSLPVRSSLEIYADKGVMEDLYPFIDQDEILGREDFITNILEAYEKEGRLYAMPIIFSVQTMLGKTSLLGKNSWTVAEMIEFCNAYPAGTPIFADASKSGVLQILTKANSNQLMDRSRKEKAFDRELFIRMLEFANRFTNDELYVSDEDWMKGIADGQLILWDTAISHPADLQLYANLYGEPVSFIGYPSESGGGFLAQAYSSIAINAGSRYKEAAWEFVRTLLTTEYHMQDTLYGFSIRRDGLEKQFEKSMEANYETDANGNKQEISKGAISTGSIVLDMYASTPEEITLIRNLIESVDKIRDTDDQINTIISEEAQMYFSGAKTAEEATDVVENRIKIYLDETKG